jgi:hypothetical protein
MEFMDAIATMPKGVRDIIYAYMWDVHGYYTRVLHGYNTLNLRNRERQVDHQEQSCSECCVMRWVTDAGVYGRVMEWQGPQRGYWSMMFWFCSVDCANSCRLHHVWSIAPCATAASSGKLDNSLE